MVAYEKENIAIIVPNRYESAKVTKVIFDALFYTSFAVLRLSEPIEGIFFPGETLASDLEDRILSPSGALQICANRLSTRIS